MEQQYVRPENLSVGMKKIWMVAEDYIDENISKDYKHAFPIGIELSGVIRKPDNSWVINPDDEEPVIVDGNFKGLYTTKVVALGICNSINERTMEKAENQRDDYLNKAETLDETIIKFLKNIEGKDTEFVGEYAK